MSYKNLVIWQVARSLVIDIHKMTLENLHDRAEILGKKLNNFIQKIEQDLAATK